MFTRTRSRGVRHTTGCVVGVLDYATVTIPAVVHAHRKVPPGMPGTLAATYATQIPPGSSGRLPTMDADTFRAQTGGGHRLPCSRAASPGEEGGVWAPPGLQRSTRGVTRPDRSAFSIRLPPMIGRTYRVIPGVGPLYKRRSRFLPTG